MLSCRRLLAVTTPRSSPEGQSAPPGRLSLLVRSTSERPAFVAGLRAAVATMVPLLVTQLLHSPGGTWASLGGFSAAVADRGGAYRIRALTMGALTVGAAIGVIVGGMIGGTTWLAVGLTFVVVGVLSLAREFGISPGGVGTSIAVAFAVSLSAPSPTASEAFQRGAYLLAGGAWAMVLALVFWPVRPYRPLRIAAARSYLELAAYADAIADLGQAVPNETQRAALVQHRRAIRDAVEAARSVVAVSRRGGQGEARRGERLLLLVQGADLLFGTLIALDELLEQASEAEQREVGKRTSDAIARFAFVARRIATTIEVEPNAPKVMSGASAVARALARPSGEDALGAQAARLLGQLEEYTTVVAANADALSSDRPPHIPPALASSPSSTTGRRCSRP